MAMWKFEISKRSSAVLIRQKFRWIGCTIKKNYTKLNNLYYLYKYISKFIGLCVGHPLSSATSLIT